MLAHALLPQQERVDRPTSCHATPLTDKARAAEAGPSAISAQSQWFDTLSHEKNTIDENITLRNRSTER
jgi:hypothetical protein